MKHWTLSTALLGGKEMENRVLCYVGGNDSLDEYSCRVKLAVTAVVDNHPQDTGHRLR